MAQLFVTTRDGKEQVIETAAQGTVMEAIRDNGIDELQAMCGGCCSCATCHVYVDAAFVDKLNPISELENDMVDGSSYREPNSRLACQIKFTAELDGLKVTIAPED